MAGGKLYIEPILEELQDKIGELETGMADIKEAMAEIPNKLDNQINELQKIVNATGTVTDFKVTSKSDSIIYSAGSELVEDGHKTNDMAYNAILKLKTFVDGHILISIAPFYGEFKSYKSGSELSWFWIDLVITDENNTTIYNNRYYTFNDGALHAQTLTFTPYELTISKNKTYTIRFSIGSTNVAMEASWGRDTWHEVNIPENVLSASFGILNLIETGGIEVIE